MHTCSLAHHFKVKYQPNYLHLPLVCFHTHIRTEYSGLSLSRIYIIFISPVYFLSSNPSISCNFLYCVYPLVLILILLLSPFWIHLFQFTRLCGSTVFASWSCVHTYVRYVLTLGTLLSPRINGYNIESLFHHNGCLLLALGICDCCSGTGSNYYLGLSDIKLYDLCNVPSHVKGILNFFLWCIKF